MTIQLAKSWVHHCFRSLGPKRTGSKIGRIVNIFRPKHSITMKVRKMMNLSDGLKSVLGLIMLRHMGQSFPANRRGRRRVTFALRTNLTCGSNGCTRHSLSSTQDSFQLHESNEDALRMAMRRTKKMSFSYQGALVKVVYFSGRKEAPFDVCRTDQVSSIRGKITLCSMY